MMNQVTENSNLYSKIAGLLQAARQNVMRAVNQTMVYTYFEIGRMIVEDEQQGKERAEYGKQVLKELSYKLTTEFGKGFSQDNLERMKRFYLTYSDSISANMLRKLENDPITQKSSAQLSHTENEENSKPQANSNQIPIIKNNANEISETLSRKFILSWSHYLKLMRIENPDERRFYEIECAANNWSLKELQRQLDSALYERLALSRDKEGVKQLAEKGQIIEKPTDFLKDPYVLEFLNLPEQHQYSESDLGNWTRSRNKRHKLKPAFA